MSRFAIDFEGWIEVEAETKDEAQDLFWEWVERIQDESGPVKWLVRIPMFDFDGSEEVEEV